MSALPQSDSLYRPPQRATETEALQDLGSLAHTAACIVPVYLYQEGCLHQEGRGK